MPSGVLFALSAYALYSCCDAIIKGLGQGLSVYEIAFFTTLFSLVPVILTTPKGESWLTFYKVKNPLLVHLRGLSGVIGNLSIIYAFVTIPLAEAYSIAFLAPIFIVLISIPFLKEQVTLRRWILLGACFVGVLIVVRPGFRELHLGHITAIIAAIAGAVTTTALRRVSKEETRVSLIAMASLYVLALNGTMMLVTRQMHWLSLQELTGLLVIGALGGTGNILFIAATRATKASAIAPLQYSQIFWAILFGAVFYSEFPAPVAYIGLAIIVVAGILNVVLGETSIRIFSRNSPAGSGPAALNETSPEAVLEAPIAGAAEATSET